MRKLLSILLATALCFSVLSFHGTVSAGETYRVLYRNEEVTDRQKLIEMYRWQKRACDFPVTGERALALASEKTTEDDTQISVQQVLECREYQDGVKEYETAFTGLTAYENGTALTAAQTIDTMSKSYSYNLLYVTMSGKIIYYISGGDFYTNLLSVSACVNNKSAADTVNLKLAFTIAAGFGSEGDWYDHDEIYSAVSGKTYTLYNQTGSTPVAVTRYQNVMEFGCYVFLNSPITEDGGYEMKFFTVQICEYIQSKVY